MIMGLFRFPEIFRPVYRDAIFRDARAGTKVYLSFDDGPSGSGTGKIIDVLKRNEVKNAVFFCTGSNIEKYPLSISDITDNGYAIGNHGYLHIDGWKTPGQEYINNCIKGSEITGSSLFRPPYGRITPGQFKILKKRHRIVFWDILLYDWDLSVDPDYILAKFKRLIRPGSVIALHDKENLCAMRVLESLIGIIKDKGYEFGDLTREYD